MTSIVISQQINDPILHTSPYLLFTVAYSSFRKLEDQSFACFEWICQGLICAFKKKVADVMLFIYNVRKETPTLNLGSVIILSFLCSN